MNTPAKTVFVFGIYLILLGTTLIFHPNLLLNLFGVPPTKDVWIRVVGLTVLLLGYLYIQSARKNIYEVFPLTVHGRSAVMFFFTGLVVFKLIDPILMLLGVIDLFGALWTFYAIRSGNKQTA